MMYRRKSNDTEELRAIKEVADALPLKNWCSYEEIGKAVAMHPGNVRKLFPGVRKKHDSPD